MFKNPVARKPAQKPDFLSRSEHGPTRRPLGPSWPGTIAQVGRRLPPRHGGRPDTICIGRPGLSRRPDQTLSFLSMSHSHDPQSHLGMATGRGVTTRPGKYRTIA
jgi:hypothetical protein